MENHYQERLNNHLFSLIQDHLYSEHFFFISDDIENKSHLDSNIYYQFFDFEQNYGLGVTEYGRVKMSIQYFERDDNFNSFNEENIEILVKSKNSEEDDFYTLFCYNKNSKDEFLKEGILSFIHQEKSLIEKISIQSSLNDSKIHRQIDKKKRI